MDRPTISDLRSEAKTFLSRHWVEHVIGSPPPEWKEAECNGVFAEIPYVTNGGCYAIALGDSVIYVGVGSSLGNLGIGARLLGHVIVRCEGTKYIRKGKWSYRLHNRWRSATRILTIGFNGDQSSLALALEDYLIRKLNPPKNKTKRTNKGSILARAVDPVAQ